MAQIVAQRFGRLCKERRRVLRRLRDTISNNNNRICKVLRIARFVTYHQDSPPVLSCNFTNQIKHFMAQRRAKSCKRLIQ